MSNDIKGLRDIMFDTLRGVKDGSIKIETAKAINDTAQTIINSAKYSSTIRKRVSRRIKIACVCTYHIKTYKYISSPIIKQDRPKNFY